MQAFSMPPPPLTETSDGVICVSGTRVTLDVIVTAYDEGAAPEEIVLRHPALSLHAAYAVVTWMLHHRGEVEAYLAANRTRAAAVRQRVEHAHPADGIRDRLMRRRTIPGA